MVIVGANGFAKEVLEIFVKKGEDLDICFYDDVTPNFPKNIYGKYKVLNSESEVKDYFSTKDARFTLGLGNPKIRQMMYNKFIGIGGIPFSTISKDSDIGSYGVEISECCNILAGVKISNDVSIGKGSMVYYNSIITHDVVIGKFCEISPDVKLLGRCRIGDYVQVGAGAIIFPDVIIGDSSIIGAGAIVRQNIPANVLAVGIPAIVKKILT